MSIESSSFASLKSALGVRFSRLDEDGIKRFKPSFGLFWEHEFSQKGQESAASFQALPNTPFTIYEVTMPSDQLRVEATLVTRLSERSFFDLSYSGTFAPHLDANKATGNFRYTW